MRKDNRAALARRFPELAAWLEAAPRARSVERVTTPRGSALAIDGIRLTSAVDPSGEADLQARLVPAAARRACVYGAEALPLVRALARRRALEHLRAVVLSPTVLAVVLEHEPASDVLSDPLLEWVRGDALGELEAPFAAAPAALRLAAPACARLRDLVRIELAGPWVRRHLAALAPELERRLDENRGLVEVDGDVASLFDTQPGACVRVAAAGPSLADSYAELARGAGPLIAVDAALRPLLAAGLRPDVVVTLDPHPEGMERVFDVAADAVRSTPLVYFPSGPPAVLARWPGPRLAAYADTPLYATLVRELPRGTLFTSGSVVHPAVDLAVRMGAGTVELHGADFALRGSQSHVEGCAWQFDLAGAGGGVWVLDAAGRKLPSLPNLIGYLRDLERYIARHPQVRFHNASGGARIEGAPAPHRHVA